MPYAMGLYALIVTVFLMVSFFAIRAWRDLAKKKREEDERRRIELTRLSEAATRIQEEVFRRIGWVYLSRKRYLAVREEFRPVFAQFETRLNELTATHPWFVAFVRGAEFQERYNSSLLADYGKKFAPFFKEIDEKGIWLTERQLEAVFSDEDAVLVNAGAWTWKTKTIESKVVHLAKNLGVPLGEILVMTYSKKSQTDMADRISESLEKSGLAFDTDWLRTNVITFHALGKRILEWRVGSGGAGVAIGRRSERFSVLDENGRRRIFDSVVKKMKETLESQELLTEFALYHLSPQADPKEFKTLDDYFKFTKQGLSTQLRQPGGVPVTVKSYGEVLIANFLWSNGVPVQYEPTDHYYTDPSTKEKRGYRPDFYLPGHGVYVEYFWVDEDWRTAPFVSALDYRSEMEKKLTWHRESGNRLVDMRYADLKQGVPSFLEKLRNELVRNGVAFKAVPPTDFVNSPDAAQPLEWVGRMMLSFLALYEESDATIESLERKVHTWFDHANYDRNSAFLRLFGLFYKEYKAALEEEGVIDFGDMIRKSASAVRSDARFGKFRYVLIDEFQDISKARAALVRAIVSGASDCRLFCVGDDWQSIYQFNWSDASIFSEFAYHFWFTKEIALDRTFRFNQGISDVSSAFVMENPDQKRKSLVSLDKSRDWKVVIVSKEGGSDDYFHGILSDIAVRSPDPWRKITVLYLTRYTRTKYRGGAFDALERFSKIRNGQDPEGWDRYSVEVKGVPFEITHMTVHKSKGLEADYVIVDFVDMAGKFSFPSKFEDDPILAMLTGGKGRKWHPYAEERRIFYVALTRWKHRAYVAHAAWSDSPFVDWLSNAGQGRFSGTVVELTADGKHVPSISVEKPRECGLCKGEMVLRTWKTRFLGCENYPRCTNIEEAPPPSCPDCKIPMVKKWSGKNGKYFWSCSRYPACKRAQNL